MQDAARDRLKIGAKMHRTFHANNLLFLKLNAQMPKDRLI